MTVIVLSVLIGLSLLAGLGLSVYGTVISFKYRWYTGVAALLVPGFAQIVGITALFGIDLLKETTKGDKNVSAA